MKTDSEILFAHLGTRARRFVEQVRAESHGYTTNPSQHGRSGFLRRDEIRFRLERLAYYRAGYGIRS